MENNNTQGFDKAKFLHSFNNEIQNRCFAIIISIMKKVGSTIAISVTTSQKFNEDSTLDKMEATEEDRENLTDATKQKLVILDIFQTAVAKEDPIKMKDLKIMETNTEVLKSHSIATENDLVNLRKIYKLLDKKQINQ